MNEMKLRTNRAGQKLGLKKPAQKFWFSTQLPGVSMKPMMPLIRNRLIQAAMK